MKMKTIINKNPFATIKLKLNIMKRKNLSKLLSLSILFVAFLTATVVNAQDVTNREVPEFTGVDVGGVLNVFLTQAPDYSVELETKGIDPLDVITEVEDGDLKIYYDGSFPKGANIIAKVTAPYFEKLKASGIASVKSTGMLEYEIFKLDVTGASKIDLEISTETMSSKIGGASNVYLKGKATVHEIDISGASLLKAEDVDSEVVNVEAGGASKAEVKANSKLTAKLTGTSNLIYEEEPEFFELTLGGLAKAGRKSDGEIIYNDFKDTTKIKFKDREFWVIDDEISKKTTAKKKRRTKFKNNWSGIDFGMNAYVNPEQSLRMKPGSEFLELDHNKSWVLNFNLFQKNFPIIKNNLGIYTGIGFGFNNYRLSDKSVTLVYNKEEIDYVIEEDITMSRNKLILSHLNIPLMLEVQTHGPKKYHRFHLAAGMNLGILMTSYISQRYEIDGDKMKRKINENFHINPFRYDATVRIGYGGINLFATYALNTLFKTNEGPELYPFSVGIRIGG